MPRDDYRFAVFEHIRKTVRKEKVDQLWILGDLTDQKDGHNSQLVNRICDEIASVVDLGPEVHIVRGNHDGTDPEWPFFRFLNHVRKVHFYCEPTVKADGTGVLPHSRTGWSGLRQDGSTLLDGFRNCKIVFTHATFRGAEGENGTTLPSDLAVPKELKAARIYSGDVHVPQKVGSVIYAGAPHHVRFGDKFSPRMLLLENGRERSIDLPGVKRWMIDCSPHDPFPSVLYPKANPFKPGDQAKVRVHLKDHELHDWHNIRRDIFERCKVLGLDVAAIELIREAATRRLLRKHAVAKRTPKELVDEYVATHKVPISVADLAGQLLKRIQQRP